MVLYFIGVFMCACAGFLLIRLLNHQRFNIALHILLSVVLGLGMAGTAAFYTHILLNQFNPWIPVILVLLIIACLFYPYALQNKLKKTKKRPADKTSALKGTSLFTHDTPFATTHTLGLAALAVLAIPLIISAYHYPLGGWDAWSCWNLKAKFIFLGHENWKDVLAPGLWRSNTHYPLLWPLINVWFSDLAGRFDQNIPMFNSITIALLTAGILLFGLLELTGMLWVAIAAAVMTTALPFNITLYTSQYSDALLGLFLLSAFICLLLAEKHAMPKLIIVSMAFLGLLAVTKNEGWIAAGCSALFILWHERSNEKGLKNLLLAFFIAFLPSIIFTLAFAPKNEAFINGLTSTDKPVTWTRLAVILAYPWFEFISGKWNGWWLFALGGMILAGKKLWQSALGIIAASLFLYGGVVLAYYAINTFFEINWWLSTTLSRILFALMPSIALWIGVGFAGLKLPSPIKGKKI